MLPQLILSFPLASWLTGFRHVIRERFMSTGGLSGEAWDNYTHLASKSILWSLRPAAILCLSLFALSNQFSSATQAAFGTSIVQHNLTSPFNIARLTDNPGFIADYVQQGDSLQAGGDVQNVITAAYIGLTPGEDNSSAFSIDGYLQKAGPQQPILSLAWSLARLTLVNSSSSLFNFSAEQTDLISGSGGAVQAYVAAEGYIVDPNCQNAPEVEWGRQSIATGLDEFIVATPDCGDIVKVYNATAPLIVDAYACSTTSTIYIWTASPADGSLPASFAATSCSISGQSAIYPGQLSEQQQAARSNGPGMDSVSLQTIMPDVVTLAGIMYFDRFGLNGSPDLLTWVRHFLRGITVLPDSFVGPACFLKVLVPTSNC